MSDLFLLAQLSDCHIGGPAKDGRTPEEGLRAGLKAAQAQGAHAILITGDLVNDEGEHEYAALAAILSGVRTPVYLLPGNHDRPERLRAAFPGHAYLPREGPLSYAVTLGEGLRLIAIDQWAGGEVHGLFSEAHAQWLEAALGEAPGAPTIVALHHPPFESHDRLFDIIALHGADRFAAVIARHPQVQRIVCGHHHRMVLGKVAGVPAIACPSTAWTFGLSLRPQDPKAPRTNEPRGYLLHVWRPGGDLATHLFTL